MVAVFRLLLCWLAYGPVLAQVRHPVPVLWMMPARSGSGAGNLTAAVVPAVRLALQDLRKQPPPLGNYELQLQLLDSQCDPAESLKALFDAMWEGPRYLLLLGGACPPVTALVARALPALGLAQVSFAAVSPSLSNGKWHGNLFSAVPSDRTLNQATVKLLQRFKWTRVGVVTQERPRFAEMKKDLMRQLLKADVQVASAESLSDACSSLRKLKERDVRIIIAQFDEDSASELFCCAHTLSLFGARYQWILVGAAGWRVSGCPAKHLLAAADGSIRLQIRRLGNTNTAGVSGRTPDDYQDSYIRHLIQEGSEVGPLHSFAYDSVWVAAKALTQVMEVVKHREKYRVQRNMTVSEEEVQRMLLEALKSTQFEGVTGPVWFRNGERMTSIELIQIQGSSDVLVGEFNTSSQQLRLMNRLLKFKGRGPARDQALVRLQPHHVGLALYVTASTAAAVLIFVSLLILCLSDLSCKRRRRTSQDRLLLLGILLSCASVLVSGLDGASVSERMFEVLCSVHLWTLSVGHASIVSALFVQAWRLYSLVGIKQKLQGRRVLLWMPLMDVCVLASWQMLDPLRRVVVHHSLESDPSDEDAFIQPYSEHCGSANTELWLTALYAFKGPLLGLGCFLAWNIRCAQVHPPAVGSKPLTLSVLAVAGFSVAGVSGALLTSPDRPVQFCLSSVLILCCSLFVLSWMFAPVIFHSRCSGSEQQRLQTDEDQLSILNQRLKSRTAQLDVEIETITMQLSGTSEPETLHVARSDGDVRPVTSRDDGQICAEDRGSERKPSSLEHVNSPEHVRRRLSVQLPILHHSYLPVIGGVSSSSSSLFDSQEMRTAPSCPTEGGGAAASAILPFTGTLTAGQRQLRYHRCS